MPDYGHPLLFGTFLTPDARAPERVVALASLTDRVGLDLVAIQDHPYQARYLDAWTLLSVIAARTDTVRVVPDVANLPLRPPAVLARSVASLDRLTGGRVELGLGTGGFWDAIEASGGPRRTPGEAVDALIEAIAIIRALWADGGAVRLDGEHYRLHGTHAGPAPAHDVGIWLGGYKPRMLGVTGRLADGWLPSSPYAPPEQLEAMNRLIDEAALAAGREAADVRRLYNVTGSFEGSGTDFLSGPPRVWVEQLAELALDEGMSGFILMADDADTIRRFAAEVAPAVSALVEAERRGTDRVAAEEPVTFWDGTERPHGPAPDPERAYTAHEQATGRHLIDVHDHLRAELGQVEDLVAQVSEGALDPSRARSQINEMTMRQNNWTLGAYCESYCRVVTTHHAIEDQSVFPHLRTGDPRLAPVLDRLQAEHLVIHDVLEAVDRALVAFVGRPQDTGPLHRALADLRESLLSHLTYEEQELVEPLSRLGFG